MKKISMLKLFELSAVPAALALSLMGGMGVRANTAKSGAKNAQSSSAKESTSWTTAVDQLSLDSKFTEAKSLLETKLKEAGQDASKQFDALWRMSRVEIFRGDDLKEKSEQEKAYQQSLAFAEEALKKNPDSAIAHIRKASALGKIALFKGVLEAKEFVKQVRDEAQKALDLKPTDPETLGLAHYVLGRTHLKLTDTPQVIRKPLGLGFGNLKEAEANLLKAVELVPNVPMFWLEVAKVAKKTENKKLFDDAKAKVASLAPVYPTDRAAKAEAATLSF